MAEDGAPVLSRYFIPTLDRGMDTIAAPRTLWANREQQGPIYREAKNVLIYNGALQQRPRYSEATSNPATQGGIVAPNTQVPMWLWCGDNQDLQTGQPGAAIGLVTTRDIWFYTLGDWNILTPRYTTGTVAVTSGSALVSGTGTAFQTRSIQIGSVIEVIDTGQVRTITAVNADSGVGALTVDANWTITDASSTYIIYRNMGERTFAPKYPVFARMFNNNLYVAGSSAGGHGVVTDPIPAVIICEDLRYTGQVGTYLVSDRDLTGSMAAAGSVISTLDEIAGMQILPDGRVCILCSDSTGAIGRVRYCSQLLQTQWNTSPAGFMDPPWVAGAGTALGMIGNALTLHYQDGVSVGEFTGQYNPPIAWTKSRAKSGCFYPRTLVSTNDGEFYLGADGRVHFFDGNSDTVLFNDTVDIFGNLSLSLVEGGGLAERCMVYGWMDSHKDEYHVAIPMALTSGGNDGATTIEFVCSLETGMVVRRDYANLFSAGTHPNRLSWNGASGFYEVTGSSTQVAGAIGTTVTGGVYNSMLYFADDPTNSENDDTWAALDVPAAYTTDTDAQVDFERWDGDLPGVEKTIDHIMFWFNNTQGGAQQGTLTVTGRLPTDPFTWTQTLTFDAPVAANDTPLIVSLEPASAESFDITLTFGTASWKWVRAMIVYHMGSETISVTDLQVEYP